MQDWQDGGMGMSNDPASIEQRPLNVGVALSGGGFRATAWGLGVMLGFAAARDAEPADPDFTHHGLPVVSVASVSGGSIANAALLMHAPSLNAISFPALLTALQGAAGHVADEGLIAPAAVTAGYLRLLKFMGWLTSLCVAAAVGAGLAMGREWSPYSLWISIVVGAVAYLIVMVATPRGSGPVIGFAVGLVAVAFGGGVELVDASNSLHPGFRLTGLVVLAVVVFGVTLRVFSWRGDRIQAALADTVLRDASGTRLLRACGQTGPHHVFCATELQSGDQFFMSPRLFTGYQFGITRDPGAWPIARAVQASAALPMAFPPQRSVLERYDVTLERFANPNVPFVDDAAHRRVALVDGGVYDNMATEWEVGFASRATRDTRITDAQQQAADFLIIANAGKGLGWSGSWPKLRLLAEAMGLLRDQSIQYDQTTSHRRRALVAMFQAAERGAPGLPRGVIVQASTSPYRVAKSVANAPGESDAKRRRAGQIQAALGDTGRQWATRARDSAAVPTVLHALGRDRTIELMYHAAVLTQTQLYIHYGIGSAQLVTRGQIAAMFGGGAGDPDD